MLDIAQIGDKGQIGPQLVRVGERAKTFSAAREHRRRIWQPDERRFDDFPDGDWVELGRAGVGHTQTSRTARAT
jgi:hypothetical protein